MLPMKQNRLLSSLRIMNSDDDIVEEAKRLLVTDELKDEIQYEVGKIISSWIGQYNNTHSQSMVQDAIVSYFQTLKIHQRIYDFAVSPDKANHEIAVHYLETPASETYVLVVKTI